MGSVNPSIDLAHDGDIAVVTIDNPPVNALKHEVRAGLIEAFQRVRNDAGVKAAVLACAGRTFSAGADITEFGKPRRSPGLIEVIETIEETGKPVVAALSRDAARRRASSSRSAAITASRRPAPASACPRSSSASCPAPAARSACRGSSGRNGAPAHRLRRPDAGRGAARRTASSTRSSTATSSRRRSPSPARSSPRSVRSPACATARIDSRRHAPTLRASTRAADASTKRARGLRAVAACVEAVRNSFDMPFDEGQARELELFMELLTSEESRAQRHIFFAEREAAKMPDMPAGREAARGAQGRR